MKLGVVTRLPRAHAQCEEHLPTWVGSRTGRSLRRAVALEVVVQNDRPLGAGA